MGIEVIERHQAIIAKALSTEAGKDMVDLLKETFVNVDLMGKTDRDTVEAVAKHDLVIYLIEMGSLK
ncbi:MAG: hypothetical protein DRQ40_08010 [Gammaproteobacteria bacterium]|nr:MAG: hypothetical protein DRQ40_08010 [Gammaproteobacteria bacterium]